MMSMPRDEVKALRERLPKGTQVELIEMNDPYRVMPAGLRGIVNFIDDTGTVFVSWENGSSLGLVRGVDRYRVIE